MNGSSPEAPGGSGGIQNIHVSVLLRESLEYLNVRPGGRYLDATLGLGGHSEGILRAGGLVLGLDRDAEALALAGERLASFGYAFKSALTPFAECLSALDALGWDEIDGVLADLGVSSLQLDSAERGFSFLTDGPLDMRMGQGTGGVTAEQLVNRLPYKRLKEIIAEYGEDPQAGAIAKAIEKARGRRPIRTTGELAGIVEEAYPPKWRATSRNHPATRTFQALRMEVNGELEQLRWFLERVTPRLKPGGRLVVISFHSLEDRIVKHFLKEASRECACPPHAPRCVCGHKASLRILLKKGLLADMEEVGDNPRARSARLRAAEKI